MPSPLAGGCAALGLLRFGYTELLAHDAMISMPQSHDKAMRA